VDFLGVTPSGGTFVRTASGIDFTIGTIPANTTWTAQVRLRFPAVATASFAFSATNSTTDTNTADDRAEISVGAVPLRLEFTPFGDDLLVLSWPSSVTNVVLQQTSALSPLAWQPVSTLPQDDGLRLQVTVDSTNSIRLYRLREP
jgi:hypothetical protein